MRTLIVLGFEPTTPYDGRRYPHKRGEEVQWIVLIGTITG